MHTMLEWIDTLLGPQYFPLVRDIYSLTLALLLAFGVIAFAAAVILRVMLGKELYHLILEVLRESVAFVVIGAIFATMAEALVTVYPRPWLRALVEFFHEALVVLVLVGIVSKSLSKTCYRFEICRAVSESINKRIRSWL